MLLFKPKWHDSTNQVLKRNEQLLLKGIQGHDTTIKISEIRNIYGDDNFDSLPTEFQVLQAIVNEQKPSNTREIVKILKNCDRENWLLISSVIKVIKLLLVMRATSAAAERSFSTMRRMKTWLRSSMKQKRFLTRWLYAIFAKI